MNDRRLSVILLAIFFVLLLYVSHGGKSTSNTKSASPSVPNERRLCPAEVCSKDQSRLRSSLEALDGLGIAKDRTPAQRLHLAVTNVVHTGCRSLMRIGGSFYGLVPDGHKYVCFDDIDFDNCLIYSFGLNTDWSFEYEMVARGCTVHGFDHTLSEKVKLFKDIKYAEVVPGFHIYLVAAGVKTNVDLKRLRENPKTSFKDTPLIDFANVLKQNSHWNRNITYLKVDIEGFELLAIPAWLNSTSLRNVQQLGMEVHALKNTAPRFINMVRDLYQDGFVPIMWDPNLAWGREGNLKTVIHTCFETVLRRTDLCLV